MSRLACDVCQRQFRSASGLNWHLDRMHDHLDEDVYSDSARFDAGYVETDLLEITVESLRAEFTGHLDRLTGSITKLSNEMEEVRRQLGEAGKSALAVQALSAETTRQSDRNAAIDELMHAVSTLVWDLDRPNRKPSIFASFAAGGPVNPPDLPYAREKVEAFFASF